MILKPYDPNEKKDLPDVDDLIFEDEPECSDR